MVSLCVCQSAPVRALVMPVCCERGLCFKNSSSHRSIEGCDSPATIPAICWRASFGNIEALCCGATAVAPMSGQSRSGVDERVQNVKVVVDDTSLATVVSRIKAWEFVCCAPSWRWRQS